MNCSEVPNTSKNMKAKSNLIVTKKGTLKLISRMIMLMTTGKAIVVKIYEGAVV